MEINPKTYEAYKLFHEGILAFCRAEQQGFRINLHYCEVTKNHLTRKIERKERKLKESKFYLRWKQVLGSVNINSNPALSIYLYKILKIKPAHTTPTGKGSTNNEALSALNIPELNILLDIRKLKKLRDTYLDAFIREQVKGYIHPSFNLNFAVTFRSSSANPNFQNIPKRDKESMRMVRKALYPRPGHQLMEVDYSGIEVRVAAAYHKDPVMLSYIKDPTSDMHGDMAKQIFMIDDWDRNRPDHKCLRSATKNGFVFPQFYGSYYKNNAMVLAGEWGGLADGKWKKGKGCPLGDGTLSDHLISKGISSMNKFIDHIKIIENDFWNNRFKVYQQWKKRHWKGYQKKGYVDSLTGFRCSGVMGRNEVINYPVQGAASHCLLWSFIELDRVIHEELIDTRIIGQIHDAIIFDVNPVELEYISKVIKRVTCKDLPKAFKWINVPVDVDAELAGIDESWSDIRDYDMVKNKFKVS